jgi:hypothetical protein
MTGSKPSQGVDLRALLEAVAASAIVVSPPKARTFADWRDMQGRADIDGVILAWIASHVPVRKPASLA